MANPKYFRKALNEVNQNNVGTLRVLIDTLKTLSETPDDAFWKEAVENGELLNRLGTRETFSKCKPTI